MYYAYMYILPTSTQAFKFVVPSSTYVAGVHVDETSKQYHYGNYRQQYRNQWPERILADSLSDMNKVDEEDRSTVCKKLASKVGLLV